MYIYIHYIRYMYIPILYKRDASTGGAAVSPPPPPPTNTHTHTYSPLYIYKRDTCTGGAAVIFPPIYFLNIFF